MKNGRDDIGAELRAHIDAHVEPLIALRTEQP